MSRSRVAFAAVAIVAFVVIGGVLIYSNQARGGGTKTFDVTVSDAKSMNPSQLPAHLDDTVTINITSNTDGEVHLHGYDLAFDCKAGQASSHQFKADKSGQFDIEWEATGTHLGFLVVT